MHAKGLTPDEYAMNHPAGRIGKRLVLKVADVMKIDGLPCCTPSQNGLAALVQLAVCPCALLPCARAPRRVACRRSVSR